jgi:amino acid adenylation domain-containing protein
VIKRENLQDLYPLSPLQEGMLYEALRNPHTTTHFEQITWHLRGAVDPDIFRRAWQLLAERHPVLRTVIVAEKASRPVQVVLRDLVPDLHVVDLSALEAAAGTRRFEDYRASDRASPPDILGPKLWRVALFTLAPERHLVLFCFHHILLDGWSLGLLLGDLMAIYNAVRTGTALPDADWPAFGSFIKHIAGADGAAARSFWAARLRGAPPSSALPTLRPRRSGRAEPVNIVRHLSRERTAAIEAHARRLAVTASSILQALWGLLLMRHNDEEAAVFAAVVSGRPGELDGAERIVGMCINTIPTVIAIEPGDSFATLVQRTHRQAAAAMPFHHVPLAEVQSDAIGSLFAYENFPLDVGLAADRQGAHDFVVEHAESVEEVPYPVTLVATPGKSLSLTLKYDPRIHDEAEIVRVADRLETLLGEALLRPDAPVDRLALLRADEETTIRSFGLRGAQFDNRASVDRLFAQVVVAQGDALAVHDGDARLNYAELDRRVDALSALLVEVGLRRGERVAVILDRSLDLVVAFLATMRAGGAYLPIDPALPVDRIAFMLNDSRPMAVIAGAAELARLALPSGARAVADLPRLPGAGLRSTPPEIAGEDVAYVIYTSGSTGRPKGALVAHRGLVNLFPQLGRLMGVGPGRSVAMIHSPSFDASILEMLTALLNGGSLVVARHDVVADAELFGAFLQHTRPNAALITPAHLRLLDADDVGVLDTLVSGGEAADADVLARYCGARRVINAYGPSEASIAATCHVVTPPLAPGDSVPIGQPLDNVDVVIVDRCGRLVPLGAPGEILIGGAALGLGYLGRPELTAERFVAHPLRPTERIYRTGDRGRWRPDGAIEYVGRIDDQVKIRGFRVEPAEIQSELASHPAVREAFVTTRRDGGGAPVLHAYVTGTEAATADELREYLARTLPDYMIPAAIVRLDRLPLLVSGKVDRAALPLPATAATRTPAGVPADPLEVALLEIWREVLDQPDLDIDARFLDSGGHSLAAMRIVTRVRRDLKRQLSLAEFFQHETVRALARCLRRNAPDAVMPITRTGEPDSGMLTHAQRRIWILDQLGNNPAAYNIGGTLILEGDLDRAAIGQAIDLLMRRHEGLRTVFPTADGGPRQQVLPTPMVAPLWRDVSNAAAPEAAAFEAAQDMVREAFDLARGPLIRIGIFRLSVRRHLLAFAMHHIIYDGWSADIIAADLSQLYTACHAGIASDLPALPISLPDAVRWLNDGTASATAARRYWRDQFAELPPPLQLPSDLPRPNVSSQVGGEVPVRVDRATLDRLAALGGPGTTTFMALVALVKAVLYRYSGQTDIVIGHPIAGRDHPDLEPLVGCFINTLALRDRLSPDWSFRRLMEAVRRTALTAFDNRTYPFDLLIEELGLPRALNRNPLFDVMVLFNQRPTRPIVFPDLAVQPVELPSQVAKFDLIFDFREAAEGITGRIAFARDLFRPETIVRLAQHLAVLADGALQDSEAPISCLPLLTEAEHHEQLVQWNGPLDGSHAPLECLHRQFAGRAAAAPDAVALVADGIRTTYGELDRMTNRLARHLQALGVGPEVPVGLSMERSRDLLVAMLGILKAGGAYVPLDPVYPDPRLDYIIQTAGLAIIVAGPAEAARLAADGRRIVRLDLEQSAIAALSDAPVEDRATAESLAYIIFTSGSTGDPKGVAISHGNVARLFTTMQPLLRFDAADVVSLFHSYAFDFSVFEIWAAWLHGGTLVMVPPDVARAPDEFLDLLRRERVTVLSQTPSAFRPLIDADRAARSPPLALRCVVFGGEALDPQSLAPWIEQRGDSAPQLINMFGITETTIHTTYHVVTRLDLGGHASPIGRPWPDTRLLILDSDRQLLPVGAVGEIHVGGPSLARGYVGRPDLTAERFIIDPFDPAGRARLYRSGDLARYRPDGTIEYHGRIDHQVKIRGYRVELAEVEARLAGHPAVQSCAVVARPRAGDNELIAHVALRSRVEIASLRDHLRQFLPDYMVPPHILLHERMPITTNGKIDRRALPEPDQASIERTVAGAPLETATEVALAEIWAAVLDRREIGRDEDFFALGGHSLNATQVVSRINERFGVNLRVRAVFEHPVLADLAVAIEDAQLLALGDARIGEMLADLNEAGGVS